MADGLGKMEEDVVRVREWDAEEAALGELLIGGDCVGEGRRGYTCGDC